MSRSSVILLAGLLGLTLSCSDMLIDDGRSDSPVENFEYLWREIDRHYSHFIIKNVNWDSVYAVYRPMVTSNLSDRELFVITCRMLEVLKDGHINVFSPFGTCGYSGWYEDYPENFTFEHVKDRYLHGVFSIAGGERITYGFLDGGIGYIHIASFTGNDWVSDIDVALEALKTARAIVLDVRNNGGGSGKSAEEVAGRFADQKRLYGYYRYRNGPEHESFTDPVPMYVEPTGNERFTGPVTVLTNRSCFSACEAFTMAMDVLPNVTIVGDVTGGGLGNPIYRELPNGWSYRFPVWLQTTRDGRALEGVGISPDVPATITKAESWSGIDTILRTAIQILDNSFS